ncbi:MAG: HAD-IC family P-type ATPase, partial [Caldilineales bacterium]
MSPASDSCASASPGRKPTTIFCRHCTSGRSAASTRRKRPAGAAVGANRLRRATRQSAWQILLNQFKSVIVLLLVVAAGASFAFGKVVDGVAVVAVILINAAIGFVTELRAVRSMEALRELNAAMTTVRRDGQLREIEADHLTPGDIVVVHSGDVVSADLRLLDVANLHVDESLLTGESAPVEKQTGPLAEEEPLAERSNMAFSGTAVTRGSGEGVVVAVGMDTELGHIASLAEGVQEERTPLEEQLDQLGRKLVWVTLGIAVLVAVAGLLAGKQLLLIVETAIALAVATVPEGLPIVATVALARGMWRMAQRNAVVNRLAAVETLGATTVICTDKTGTLTENRMTVSQIRLAGGTVRTANGHEGQEAGFSRNGQTLSLSDQPVLRQTLEVGVLCNNAALQSNGTGDNGARATGEPLEVALLAAGAAADLHRDELLERQPMEHQVAFDSDLKMMATVHRRNGDFRVAVKGAPEAVLDVCTAVRTESGDQPIDDAKRAAWREHDQEMAGRGLRVLA